MQLDGGVRTLQGPVHNVIAATILIVAAIFVLPASHAATMGMRWDAVNDPDLAGYRVFYGTSPGNYATNVDVGVVTSTTLTGLTSCTQYYAAVKARNTADLVSDGYSNEISGWPRPEVATATPSTVVQGTQFALSIQGDNFRPGSTVQFNPPVLQQVALTVDSCSRISMTVSVDAAATLGPVTVTVVHPDNVFGEAVGLITVTSDTSGPQISVVGASNIGATTATITWTTDEPADSTVRFRQTGESAWQQVPTDTTFVTSHSIALIGLDPATAYEVQLESADDQGNSSQAGGPNFTTTSSALAYMAIEAEWVTVGGSISQGSAVQAFGGAYIRQSPTASSGTQANPSGTWNLEFEAPRAATWRFWYRLSAAESADGAWFESVNGSSFAAVQAGGAADWTWVSGRPFTLTAGLHSLTIGGNQPGAWLDRILITDDANFTPFAGPNGDTTAPPAVTAVSATGSDQTVTLAWVDPNVPDLTQIVIRSSTGPNFPAHPSAGDPVADVAGSPGNSGGWIHTGRVNGVTYRYSIFAIDGSGNVSVKATITGVPEASVAPPSDVENLIRDDTL